MPETAVLPLLRNLYAEMDGYRAASATRAGLTKSDLRALDVIVEHPQLLAGDLASHVCLTTGAVTGVLDRLEDAGLVQRRSGDDRRKVFVVATARGIGVSEDAWRPVGDVLKDELVAFSAAELTAARSLLRFALLAVRRARSRAGDG